MKQRPARTGRNPRTGAHVSVDHKYAAYFKTRKEMRERLNREGVAILLTAGAHCEAAKRGRQ